MAHDCWHFIVKSGGWSPFAATSGGLSPSTVRSGGGGSLRLHSAHAGIGGAGRYRHASCLASLMRPPTYSICFGMAQMVVCSSFFFNRCRRRNSGSSRRGFQRRCGRLAKRIPRSWKRRASRCLTCRTEDDSEKVLGSSSSRISGPHRRLHFGTIGTGGFQFRYG